MMLGILGSWRVAWALSRADTGLEELAVYEAEQRAAAQRVQGSNALIFRQLAVTQTFFGAARAQLLPVVRRVLPVERAMARRESLVDEPLPEL